MHLVSARRILIVLAVLGGFHAQVVRAQSTASPPPDPQAIDPASPMAPLPDLGVAWPDLGTPDIVEGVPEQVTPPGTVIEGDRRYSVTLAGVDGLPSDVTSRFDALSALRQNDGKPANAAQISRRAKDDAETLGVILRADGFYDAAIETDVKLDGDRLRVTLSVIPGKRYTFSDVRVAGLEPTDDKAPAMREEFGVKPAAPVDADTVVEGQLALREKLGREGFPFAKVADSEVVVDRAAGTATLDLKVDPGTPRRIGKIVVLGEDPPFDARHAQVIARFSPGEVYNQTMIDDLRRAIVATGLVSTARIEPVAVGSDLVDINTTIESAPARTVAGEIGYGTGEGFRIEASWQHRNLIRPEGAVTIRGVAGTREQSISALLRMGNFRRRDVVLNGRIAVSRERLDAYDAEMIEFSANLERQTNLIWQKKWTYSLGFELLTSRERDFVPTAGIAQTRTFFIGALPGTLAYDGSDDLLNPTRGFRLSGRLSPEASLQGSVFGYARAQIDGSVYVPFGRSLVIAGRTRLGFIAGAGRDTIAPSRLFYAGGGGSVRGFGYQGLGPQNVLGQPDGGRSLAEFAIEARVRLPFFGGNFGVVPFIDAGNVYDTSYPRFTDLRVGAGLGFRYYSNFGPIRIDVGTPIARRTGESPIAVYVSLGQAF
jgi:translocation and assembly module TamA